MIERTFKPGEVIEMAGLHELAQLEDVIPAQIYPYISEKELDIWNTRDRLQDIIRPPKYNGSITDITLQVMNDPAEMIFSAKDRGHKFYKSRGAPQFQKMDTVLPNLIGFTFLANAKSSGRGVIGQIQSELYYFPTPVEFFERYRQHNGELVHSHTYVFKHQSTFTYGSVRRAIVLPTFEKENFIELEETSKRIGFQVLRSAMRHPISTPMGGQNKQ